MDKFNHKPIQKRMDQLAARWADEHQYEDFNEYKKVMEQTVTAAGATFGSMTQRPFACTYSTPGVVWTCTVGRGLITVEGVKAP